MALYDGFFDAVLDETAEEYDRVYESGDFTSYFANIIGSGVCIHNNPDSFKAEYENGTLYLRPGYLFIQGHWLANRAEAGETDYKGYAVTLPTNMVGSMAVVAHLNMGQRMIEIEVRAVSQAYPDALVLAMITASTAEDTRHNTDICGVIDTAGELSSKVEWALNYIDTEVGEKLSQAEADIAAQSKKLDEAIASVNVQIDKIIPQSIGTIKFSTAKNIGDDWLPCDGRFISDNEYPALAEVLRGTTHGIKNIYEVASWPVSDYLGYGCFYAGYYWNISEDKILYRVSLDGGSVSEIQLLGESRNSINSSGTVSIVEINGATRFYFVPRQSGKQKRDSEGEFVCYPAVYYYYCDNFDIDADSVSLIYKTASFDSFILTDVLETDSTLRYSGFLGGEWDFRPTPVVVLNSTPYIAAGVFTWSSYPKGTINYPSLPSGYPGYCIIAQYLEWFSVDPGNEEVIPYLFYYTSTTNPLNDSTIKDLKLGVENIIKGVPFSENSGGLFFPQTYTSSNKKEVWAIKGNQHQVIGRGAVFPEISSNINNIPVFNQNYIVFSAAYSSVAAMNISTMKGFKASFNGLSFLSNISRVFLYLDNFDIWVLLSYKKIVFVRDLENTAHNMILDLSGMIKNESSLIEEFIEYDSEKKCIYYGWSSSNYHIHLLAIELPDDFDPINGTNLPVLSMSGVPAYIKAKEAES